MKWTDGSYDHIVAFALTRHPDDDVGARSVDADVDFERSGEWLESASAVCSDSAGRNGSDRANARDDSDESDERRFEEHGWMLYNSMVRCSQAIARSMEGLRYSLSWLEYELSEKKRSWKDGYSGIFHQALYHPLAVQRYRIDGYSEPAGEP